MKPHSDSLPLTETPSDSRVLRAQLAASLAARGVPCDVEASLWLDTVVSTWRIAMVLEAAAYRAPEEGVTTQARVGCFEAAAKAQDRLRRALRDLASWMEKRAAKEATPEERTVRKGKAVRAAGPDVPDGEAGLCAAPEGAIAAATGVPVQAPGEAPTQRKPKPAATGSGRAMPRRDVWSMPAAERAQVLRTAIPPLPGQEIPDFPLPPPPKSAAA